MVGGKTVHLRKMVHQEDLVAEQDITVALQEVQVMFNLQLQDKVMLVELEVDTLRFMVHIVTKMLILVSQVIVIVKLITVALVVEELDKGLGLCQSESELFR